MSLRPNVLKGLFQVFVQTLGANLSGFQAFAVENACGSLSKMFHISIWKFKSNARLNLFWPIFFELSPPEIFGDFRLRNQTLTTSYEFFPLFSELCSSENFHDWISENFHDWISFFRIWPIRNLSRLETPVRSTPLPLALMVKMRLKEQFLSSLADLKSSTTRNPGC